MKKGFTLVEILFVLAVISIVVGIGLTNMKDSTEQAVIAKMKSDARDVIAWQYKNFADNRSYAEVPEGSDLKATIKQ